MIKDELGNPPFITPQGRDLRLDLLRGYFVFAMVVDHVCGMSPLWYLTGGNRFFAGAAEGFVLTSGLVAGLVYARRIKRDGLGPSLVKVLSRVFTLYLLTVALTLALVPFSELFHLPWSQGVMTRDPLSAVVSILTLHRTYYLVDVMLLYTVLFLLTPLALVLLEQGKRGWVLGTSWLLWGAFQLWPHCLALPWPIAGNHLFNFSAWQVIFFSALVLGYGRPVLPVPRPHRARLLLALSGAVLLLLVALFFVVHSPGAAGPKLVALVEDLFLDKVNLRPGRVLAAGVTFSFLFLAVTVFWQPVRRGLGWLLLPLGQQALYAYTAHVGLVALVAIALARLGLGSPGLVWLNALIQVAAVALIWLLVRYQVLAPTPRTRRLYHLAPVPLTVLAVCVFHFAPTLAYADPAGTAQAVNRFGTPLPTAAQVNRFGTPLPTDAVQANRFDTPLPAATPTLDVDGLGASWPSGPPVDTPEPVAVHEAGPSPTAQPAPTPDVKPADPAEALARVAHWVGAINGGLEEVWFYSDALGREMPFWVYLPPGYATDGRHYPVLYMLHGAGGHRDEWICYNLVQVADWEMSQGTLSPMIIILPQGDRGFWVNNVGDGPRWGDYVAQDLVLYVDSTFRTLPVAESRAIGGLSMGGFGALTLAFTHLDTFGVVGAHSPSLHPEGWNLSFLGSGEEFAERDPLSLAGTLPGLERLRIWIDVAVEDNWLGRVHELHETIAWRGIEHAWHVFPGTHVGEYWITHTPEYLGFYADTLSAQVQ